MAIVRMLSSLIQNQPSSAELLTGNQVTLPCGFDDAHRDLAAVGNQKRLELLHGRLILLVRRKAPEAM